MTINNDNTIKKTVDLFKIYSDYTRLRIIDLLADEEFCVQDISIALNTSQSAISHQLKQLRDNDVVTSRKEGKNIYYALKDNHIKDIFLIASNHIKNCL